MADKEKRIYVRQYGEDNPCDTCEDKSGDECDFCVKNYEWNASIPRTEAIKRMAKAIWEIGHNEVLNISFDELKTKSHKSKSTTFGNFYKLTVERAEAALNALLKKEANK